MNGLANPIGGSATLQRAAYSAVPKRRRASDGAMASGAKIFSGWSYLRQSGDLHELQT
jgi:hypothetical protein